MFGGTGNLKPEIEANLAEVPIPRKEIKSRSQAASDDIDELLQYAYGTEFKGGLPKDQAFKNRPAMKFAILKRKPR